ncbi:MAG: tetratricopeptide repeat protein [Planctomycetes bacterium]|nr:tetratricopeptide repeat protein [Planctomycetota bacterium]MBL7042011.1 tetratricopeptide repeat protein [Pirellulaceae bacterium]
MINPTVGRSGVIVLFSLAFSVPAGVFAAEENVSDEARRLFLTGRYAEAAEVYGQLANDRPSDAALGLARCHWETGKLDEAEEVLRVAAKSQADDADLAAHRALLAFARGQHDTAQKLVDKTITLDAAQPIARWVNAELHRVSGRMKEANDAYEWFIDYYNGNDKFTPEDLHWIGLAAAQYARWSRNSGQFRFLVNTLYPDVLELDENYWPARLESGLLFLEKYNQRDAKVDLDAALTINPNAAEVHAVRAMLAVQDFNIRTANESLDEALKINPRLLVAHQLRADCLLAELRVADAIRILDEARKLNAVDEETLGRLAAAYAVIDGAQETVADSRVAKLIAEVVQRNEHCGRFFMALAGSMDRMRRYPAAAKYYREAQRRMPQLMYAQGQLGLVLMRLGDEAEARKLLDKSFEIDAFNVRVKNMLEVLDILENYAVIETDHFKIKFDGERDEILAEYAARYLEDEVYPEIVQSLGYEPPGKSLFEIFSRANNTSGHGWFSARMVGLPFIGTVGACAGRMVAMVSPNDMRRSFSWARVLRHEFVHVVNLQQTDFRIPHWYTEGLAVWHEGLARPPGWNEVLARRVRADTLFDLDTINLGFIRPKQQEDWTLAYCQAELYVEFMLERFGDDAISKLLAAYTDNFGTEDAVKRCFGVGQEEFEKAYREYVDKIVDGLPDAAQQSTRSFAELRKAAEQDPKDAGLQAELAYQYLQRGEAPTARKHAMAARQLDEKHQLAAYVLARLYLSIGDTTKALEILNRSLDGETPQKNALALLAGLRLKAGDYAEAERLYRLGAEAFPNSPNWLKSLSSVYLKSGDKQKLTASLAKLAKADYDNVIIRKKLLELAIEAEDFDAAVRWANQTLHIDVMDADVHASLALALARLKKHARAIGAYETAIHLSPERDDWRYSLGEQCVQAGEKEKAVAVLEELLSREPEHAEAKKLLEELSPK